MHYRQNSRTWASRGRLAAPAIMLAGIFCFASAEAATYYVSPSGSDSNPGTSPGSAWATINKANAALRAGDVCIISPGAYSHPINPSSNGTAGARITYVGSLSNPTAAQVSYVDIAKTYITVKGISTPPGGALTLQYLNESSAARNDSVAYCTIRGGVAFRGAKRSMVARNSFSGGVAFELDHGLSSFPAIANSESDTLRGNVVDFGTITWKGFVIRGYTSFCVIDSNRFSGMFTGTNSDVQGRYLYGSHANVLRDNRWTFEATNSLGGGNPWVAFAMRDSSVNNLFERDTMLCGVQSNTIMGGRLVNAGSPILVGKCTGNRWTGCFYKTTSYSWTQDNLVNSTIENSVFASKYDYALWFLGDVINCKLRNNTFYSGRNRPIRFEGSIFPGTTEIFNNIVYADSVTACSGGGGILLHGATSGFTENNNLFFARKGPAGVDPSTMSILFGQCSRPGTGQPWFNATGKDGNSKWGSPRFVDSTFTTFDPHLRTGSIAIGLGQGGVDAGAYPFAASGPDVTPPAPISDLIATQIADNNLVLRWTAPGDDGSSGVASSYDLRWQIQPIDNGNFGSALPVPVQPIPGPAGTLQTYIMIGLAAGTQYHFAIKTRDDANNVSALSNVLRVTTLTSDQVSPAGILDLSTQP
ncbi:MAG TPA: fibronectin type III domain-containing protein [Candidatus Limnocylindria bacterium]|nr:fibronectin type III domain-containing protein [Candidatus Limnocylindria bacterium]